MPVPLWHHMKSTTLPFEVRLPHLSFTASNDFLIRTFPLQIKRDIAGLPLTAPPCTGKNEPGTPTTWFLIVWPLQSQSLRVGYGKLCSPSGREPTAYWRAPAFRRGLESAVFKKMNGGGPFRGGAGAETRTPNLMITRHLLYQLELRQHIGGRHCFNHLNYRPQVGPGGIRTRIFGRRCTKSGFNGYRLLKETAAFHRVGSTPRTQHYRSNSMRC